MGRGGGGYFVRSSFCKYGNLKGKVFRKEAILKESQSFLKSSVLFVYETMDR